MNRWRVGVVGCGMISDIYLKNLTGVFQETEVKGVWAPSIKSRKDRTVQYKLPKVYNTYTEMLNDPDIDVILNLTPPNIHAELTKEAILCGKHVYSEKPLATSYNEALELLHMAKQARVRLGCAPDVFLGGMLQTCKDLISSGILGKVFGFSANMMKRGIEKWHPNPQFLYQRGGGPLLDMGPYYISALVYLLGSVEEVFGMNKTPFKEHIIPWSGVKFDVETPTFYTSVIRFKSGVIGNFNATFDVHTSSSPYIELYGENGVLSIPDPNRFNGEIRLYRYDDNCSILCPITHKFTEDSRGIGLVDMFNAMKMGRQHTASAEMAVHILEVLEGIERSCQSQVPIKILSSYF